MRQVVVSHEDLMEATLRLAQRIAEGATYCMALIEKLVQQSLYVDFAESLRLAGPARGIARCTTDHREGVRLRGNRRPSFRGR